MLNSVLKAPMLIIAFLVAAACLTGHRYPQTDSGPVQNAAASRTTAPADKEREVAQMQDDSAIQAVGQSHTKTRVRTHAKAQIVVHDSEAKPYDETAGPALTEIHLEETFTGDIDGESTVRALQVAGPNKSARLISLQRFNGKLGGREGTFVLQGSETVVSGKIKATWFVVPGSGTGDLRGLRAEGGFEGEFGKGSEGTLDYWFE